MKVIWKYEFDITDTQVLNTKEGAKFLAVQLQGYYPVIWVEVDTENPNKEYILEVFGTGNPMTEYHRTYIGTIQERAYVWHVYVRDEPVKTTEPAKPLKNVKSVKTVRAIEADDVVDAEIVNE